MNLEDLKKTYTDTWNSFVLSNLSKNQSKGDKMLFLEVMSDIEIEMLEHIDDHDILSFWDEIPSHFEYWNEVLNIFENI